jgi:hypothetical protein
MKKIILLLILIFNVFLCVAQSDSVIIVSQIQYHAVLKRDSIMKANKAKPKVFKVPSYHGPKVFKTPITIIQVENEKIYKKSDLPFYQKREYVHINNTFNVPVSSDIVNDASTKVTKDVSTKVTKDVSTKVTTKDEKAIELQKQRDIHQKQKDKKVIKLQKQKDKKAKEFQKQKDKKAKEYQKRRNIRQKHKEATNKHIKKEKERKYKKILKDKQEDERDFTNQPNSERFFPTK